jgi:TrwC relaxase
MTFGASKSVSVLWALSERQAIAQARRSAVQAATTQLEATAGWAGVAAPEPRASKPPGF